MTRDAIASPPIAALATASGPAGVSVVRVSGDGALTIGDRLAREAVCKPTSRPGGSFFHARVFDPHSGEAIDDAVWLVFRAPNSFTGEETLEIQGHGGCVPSKRLLEAVLSAGARLAEPGEFTKRAFLNGRLDLTQAEAICDLIQARTERAAHVARAQLDGVLGRRVGSLYDRLTGLCADVEHLLDFDEGELPDPFLKQAETRLVGLREEMEALIGTWREGHLVRDGALVVIGGRPNAGKSSLLNALLGQDRAIVHHEPGTTRDVIEEGCAVEGVPLRLVDTAGLRDTVDTVETEGVFRARSLMRAADITIYLVDGSLPGDPVETAEFSALDPARTVIGLAKCDLPCLREPHVWPEFTEVRFSSKTGEGLHALRAAVLAKLGVEREAPDQPIVALRHVSELREAVEQARMACTALREGSDYLVIAANHLRKAAEALGRIVGRGYSADLLDSIFGRFCVGK